VNLESVTTRAVFPDATGGHPASERRVRGRVGLHWPLSILKGQREARVLCTVTENLSSGGFCCVLEEPVAAGECMVCIIGLPLRRDLDKSQALRCQIQVVWVRGMEDGRFGIGCRIDDYIVIA